MEFLAFALVCLLAFANGANDVSKAIATLVGSGVTHYRTAIAWGTVWTVAGACAAAFAATAMVTTFSTGFVRTDLPVAPVVGLAVTIGALVWVLVASRTGLPVSTTHALMGAIVGAGSLAWGSAGLLWTAIGQKVALPLLLSPVFALTVSLVIHPVVRVVAGRWEGACLCLMPAARALVTIDATGTTRTLFQATGFGQPVAAVPAQCDQAGLRGLTISPDTIHWLSSGLTAFARGANDAPKLVAMLMLGGMAASWTSPGAVHLAFLGVALAMGLGSFLGGLRVTEVLAGKVTRMNHADGLSANLTTSSLVFVSATMGLPVSTTHVSSSAIIGIGLLKGRQAVQWTIVRDMVLAWIVTLPASALLACLAFLLLNPLL